MGVMDNFLKAIKLDSPDDEYYDDEKEDYYGKSNSPLKSTPIGKDDPSIEVPKEKLDRPNPTKAIASFASRKSNSKTMTAGGMEVCVIKPTSFDDSREITETLLSNRTVVLNLEGLDVDIAQRIIDFASGSCFAMDGKLQKISRYIFIITPPSVDISGDFQDMMGAFDTGIHDGPDSLI